MFKLKYEGEIGYIVSTSLEETGLVEHAFSTRGGGVSLPPYHSLNLGLDVGDDQERVMENRRRFCSSLGFNPQRLVAAEQIHGDGISIVAGEETGRVISSTDALLTKEVNLPLTIYTADCLPIFVLDRAKKVIAALHVGWKGTALRLTQKALLAMQKIYGTVLSDCLVVIGPSIGPCCYEVDDLVRGQFKEAFFNGRGFAKAKGKGKWSLDLRVANVKQLEDLGMNPIQIYVNELCTYCNSPLFFSYRRDKGKTGRMMNILMLKQEKKTRKGVRVISPKILPSPLLLYTAFLSPFC